MDDYDLFNQKRDQEVDVLLSQVRDLLQDGPAPDAAASSPAPQQDDTEADSTGVQETVSPEVGEEPTRRLDLPQELMDKTQRYQPVTNAVPAKPVEPPTVSGSSEEPQEAVSPESKTASQEPRPDKPLTWRERRALERQRRSEEPGSPPTGYFWSSVKMALYVLGVLTASVLIAICLWLAADDVFGLTSRDRSAQVTVAESDSIAEIADKLEEAGIIKYPSLFRIYGRLFHAADKIQPGDYTLNAMYDYRAVVVGMMGSYKARGTARVTIPEGYSVAQIFDLLEQSGVATVEELTETANNYDFGYSFLEGSQLEGLQKLEGYLFPDTYEFYLEDDPVNVLDKLLTNFDQKFTQDMLVRLEELNQELTAQANSQGIAGSFQLTLADVVTVASLIEKEASVSAERTTVASVIYNRLINPNYPLLQIDATVLYALGDWSKQITYADLEIDSPYNTYLYGGLPAGPICNPGINCLKAALYPADTDYYYYALNTDGTHHFSLNAEEHQAFLDSLEG